jgi:uncharacterized membrane-anchored protein
VVRRDQPRSSCRSRWLPFYWATVVAIRAAGTAVGDTLSGRNMLGLPMSTAVTGIVFVTLLVAWKESAKPEKAFATEGVIP